MRRRHARVVGGRPVLHCHWRSAALIILYTSVFAISALPAPHVSQDASKTSALTRRVPAAARELGRKTCPSILAGCR